ncbi:MAG: hypothetical protein LKKZDAJK_002166 [Candidatus Fervidibacter sp.]
MTVPLNTDQKRFLTAALAELEEHLLRFNALLQRDETITVFRRVPNPFSPERRRRLLELITTTTEHLRAMREAFGLPIEEADLRWQMTATLLHFATNLEECEPHRLKAFGDLDEETAKQLTEQLHTLTGLLAQLRTEAKR